MRLRGAQMRLRGVQGRRRLLTRRRELLALSADGQDWNEGEPVERVQTTAPGMHEITTVYKVNTSPFQRDYRLHISAADRW